MNTTGACIRSSGLQHDEDAVRMHFAYRSSDLTKTPGVPALWRSLDELDAPVDRIEAHDFFLLFLLTCS